MKHQVDLTLMATMATILEGTVLHVRAAALPGRRKHPRRIAMPRVDLTLGPSPGGRFLLVDYQRVTSGLVEHHESADDAVRAVRQLLGWARLAALRAVHGEPEKMPRSWSGLGGSRSLYR